MSQEDNHPRALRYVPAHRISTDAGGTPPVEESVGVALEGTVTIEIDGSISQTKRNRAATAAALTPVAMNPVT